MRSARLACIVTAVVAALGAVSAAQIPPAPPDTAATRQLTRWLDTFNRGDRDTWRRFLAEAWPSQPESSIEPQLAFRSQTGGFDLIRFEASTPARATALLKVRDAESAAARLTIEIDVGTGQIVRISLEPGLRLPSGAPRSSDAMLADTVRSWLERRAADDRFSGAVLVAKNGNVLFSGAYGAADRAGGIANTLTTRFRNGSMSKMFTAVAVLALVQAGKLRLDAPIGTYLADYPNRRLAASVTVHHLLTHTGGTGDIFGPDLTRERARLRTHADYIALFGQRDLLFEPGRRWMYSNYGYILLGAVIERVAGEDYYDYVRRHVFAPAGMTDTGAEPEEADVPRLSIGYMRRPPSPVWEPNDTTLPYRGTAAGGGYTTVGDLLTFATALTRGTLLDRRHTDLLVRGKVDGAGGRYAYGFIEQTVDGVRSFGHGGNAPGMDGDLAIYPESGYVVAVLANIDPPAAQRVAEFITNRLAVK